MGTIQPRYKIQIGREPLKKKLHTHNREYRKQKPSDGSGR